MKFLGSIISARTCVTLLRALLLQSSCCNATEWTNEPSPQQLSTSLLARPVFNDRPSLCWLVRFLFAKEGAEGKDLPSDGLQKCDIIRSSPESTRRSRRTDDNYIYSCFAMCVVYFSAISGYYYESSERVSRLSPEINPGRSERRQMQLRWRCSYLLIIALGIYWRRSGGWVFWAA